MRRPTRYTMLRWKVRGWRMAVLLGWLGLLEWWEEVRMAFWHRWAAEQLSRDPLRFGRKPFAQPKRAPGGAMDWAD